VNGVLFPLGGAYDHNVFDSNTGANVSGGVNLGVNVCGGNTTCP
jgi:hypothetical protein